MTGIVRNIAQYIEQLCQGIFYHLETWAQAITTVTTKTGILKKCLEDKGFMDKGADDVFVHVRDNPDLSIDVVGQHCAIELVYDSWNCKQKGIHLTTEAPVFEPVTVPWIDPPKQKKRLVTVATFPWSSMGPAKKNQDGTKKNLLLPDQSTLTHDQRNQEESPVTNTLFSKLAVLESTDFAPSTRVDRCTGWPFNKKCKMQGIPSFVILCPDASFCTKD